MGQRHPGLRVSPRDRSNNTENIHDALPDPIIPMERSHAVDFKITIGPDYRTVDYNLQYVTFGNVLPAQTING